MGLKRPLGLKQVDCPRWLRSSDRDQYPRPVQVTSVAYKGGEVWNVPTSICRPPLRRVPLFFENEKNKG